MNDEKARATLRLIRAIGSPPSSLPLAQRILSSSIGNASSPALLLHRDAHGEGRNSEASFMKRLVRSYAMYRKKEQTRNRDTNVDGSDRKTLRVLLRQEISSEVEKIENLHRQLEDVALDTYGDGTMAEKIAMGTMTLLSHLIGTRDHQRAIDSAALSSTDMRNAKLQSSIDVHQINTDTNTLTRDETRKKRVYPSYKEKEDTECADTASEPNIVTHDTKYDDSWAAEWDEERIHSHLQSLRHEEHMLVRECIFSLQGISGARVRFLRHVENDEFEASSNVSSDWEGLCLNPCLPSDIFDVEGRFPRVSPMYKANCISPAVIDAVKLCGECGWLFLKLKDYIDAKMDTNAFPVCNNNAGMGGGMISRALASALSEELEKYHQLIAALEVRHADRNITAEEAPRNEWESLEPNMGPLSLRKLVVYVRPATQKLCKLGILVDGVHALQGGQLASAIHQHVINVQAGQAPYSQMIHRLACRSFTPLYDFMFSWVFEGVLGVSEAVTSSNAYKTEFFVIENSRIDDAYLWEADGRYDLQCDMIPCFLPKLLAAKILNVGKCVNFVRRCLKPKHSSSSAIKSWDLLAILINFREEKADDEMAFKEHAFVAAEQSPVRTTFDILGECLGFSYGDGSKLKCTIDVLYNLAHSHILDDLFGRFKLREHMLALKKIILLSQGDFLQALLEGLAPVMLKHKREKANCKPIFGGPNPRKHTLISIVESALQTTNAKFLSQDMLARVRVRLAEPSKSSDKTAWDLFFLDYAIDAPLTSVIHPNAQAKYRLVFQFLWRLKRLEWGLTGTWRQATAVNHAILTQSLQNRKGLRVSNTALGKNSEGGSTRNDPSMASSKSTKAQERKALRKAAMTRQEILHFTSNLQSYLMFEVLECSWSQLQENLCSAKTLDDVIDAHDSYLEDIVTKSLLSSSDNRKAHDDVVEMSAQLSAVLDCAARFIEVQETMFDNAIEAIELAERKRRIAVQRTESGKWGYGTQGDCVDLRENSFVDERQVDAIFDCASDFDVALRVFLKLLNHRLDIGGQPDRIETPGTGQTSTSLHEFSVNGRYQRRFECEEALRFLTFRLDFNKYYNLVR